MSIYLNKAFKGKVLVLLVLALFLSGCTLGRYSERQDYKPYIVVDSLNNVHLVWESEIAKNKEYLYYKKLDSNGNTLIDSTKLIKTNRLAGQTSGPETVIDSDNNLHVFKQEGEWTPRFWIRYLKIEDGKILENKKIGIHTEARDQKVTIDKKDNIHLVWNEWQQLENRDWDINLYYAKLSKKGDFIVGPKEIINLNDIKGLHLEPNKIIVDDSDKVHISYADSRYIMLDSNGNILKEGNLEGISEESLKLTFSFGDSGIIDSQNNLHLISSESKMSESASLIYTKKEDGEILVNKIIHKFGAEEPYEEEGIRFGREPAIFEPRVALENGNLHVIWYMNNGKNKFEIYYTKLDLNGDVLLKLRRLV